MNKEIKTISIKEFREFGFLQELNRQFLHPLGLALSVAIHENGNETLNNIWDYRDDPEGINYNIKDSNKERLNQFVKKEKNVITHSLKIAKTRFKKLGYIIEPINNVLDEENPNQLKLDL